MGRERPRAAIYIADRADGLTYRQIAAKHGVSYQTVAQACARGRPSEKFKPYSEEEVVYPNLRQWLNENKICRTEFIRRLGNQVHTGTRATLGAWLTGRYFPSKNDIDRLLNVTGLTYEELFATEESQSQKLERIAVVRCRDCKHWNGGWRECPWAGYPEEEDYCSKGERRDNDA